MSSRTRKLLSLCEKENYFKKKVDGVNSVHNKPEEPEEEKDIPNYFDVGTETNCTNIKEVHITQGEAKGGHTDLVKKWVESSDFTCLTSPEHGKERKEYTELLPLIEQGIETPQICNNNLPASNPFCTEAGSNSSQQSKIIKIIENIVISESNAKLISDKAIAFEDDNEYSEIISGTVGDDTRDKDFNIREYSCSSSSSSANNNFDETIGDNEVTFSKNLHTIEDQNIDDEVITKPLSGQIKEKRTSEKKIIRCKYCEEDVLSKNFMRHIERHHSSEKEVENILKLPKNSKERRMALILLRKDTNFRLHISGTTRPYRQSKKKLGEKRDYYPCIYCKGLFKKQYLKRHSKICSSKPQTFEQTRNRNDHVSNSQTIMACASDPTDTISKLDIKNQVFDKMKGDEIAFEAKKDLLIAHFGESYLKKHKRERMAYACSNRMRELSRLLISYRKITNDSKVSFKDILHPKNFDNVLSAARSIVGYDPIKKTFKSPSLAMHMGTSLKTVCDELTHLILKENLGFKCNTAAHMPIWLNNVKYFKQLVESRWNSELASLASKDLQEKRWNKPLLLPLVSDIKIFRDQCLKTADKCVNIFQAKTDEMKTYKLLVNSTLALLIVFNRRRIGDVQFLKISDYEKDHRSNLADFESALTETEKILTTKYKRVLNSGKGSRAVVILIPELLQNYVNILLNNREKYISSENDYVFAIPGSSVPWGKGDVAIRSLASKMNLKNPLSISSNKLRKHIATIMQILSLSKDEAKQFSKFMGHTEKTHEEFYELPVDIYQTAKVSKILLMMEKGTIPLEHKGKSLAEISFDTNLEYAEENDIAVGDGAIFLNEKTHVSSESAILHNDQPSTSRQHHEIIPSDESDDVDLNNYLEKKSSKTAKRKTATKKASDDSSDDELGNVSKKTSKTKKKQATATKRGWTSTEVAALEREFASFIKKKTYPSGQAIKDFMEKHNLNRSVSVIKSKLQHLIKLSNQH